MSNSSPTPAANGQASSSDEGMLSRFKRTASTLKDQGFNYFTTQTQNEAKQQPTTPDVSNATGSNGPSAKEQEKETAGRPTAFERFMNLGKARKDQQVTFPPPHWESGEGTEKKDTVQPGPCS